MGKSSFPNSSVGKESACNARDPSSTPESGRFPGEGNEYPLQYSWASLVVQLVKNLPSMLVTWVPFLVWEDPLEKRKATYSSILVLYNPWGHKESDKTEGLSLSLTLQYCDGFLAGDSTTSATWKANSKCLKERKCCQSHRGEGAEDNGKCSLEPR